MDQTKSSQMTDSDISHKRKQYSRQKYEYVNELNTELLYELQNYNGYELNRYFFDGKTETLYIYTRHKYKVVKPTFTGLMYIVALVDVNGKAHSCSYNKLIRELKAQIDDERN